MRLVPKSILLPLILFYLCAIPFNARGNTVSDFPDYEEVFLEFRYLQVVNTTVIGYYRDGVFFLPVVEMFNMLLVYNEMNWDRLRLEGYFSNPANSFFLDFDSRRYRYKNQSGDLPVESFIVDQFDVYLDSRMFNEIFAMEFDINSVYMFMRLFSEERMPIRIRQDRLLARQRNLARMGTTELYQPNIPRNKQILNGGFVDYNLNYNTQNFNIHTGSLGLTVGTEVLFGDFQGSLFLTNSSTGSQSANFSNWRWRYYAPDGFIKQYRVGNLQSRGITYNRPIRGVSITNEPLYPSRVFDEFNYTDTANPYTEVEIYINDRLFDFFVVDETGLVNIQLPITYGINDIRIVKYSRDGQVSEVNRRLNVPFYFVPPQKLYFTAYAGQSSENVFNQVQRNVGLIDLAYGLSPSSTIRSKAEFVTGEDKNDMAYQLEYSQRIKSRVITNVQYSPLRFESISLSYQSPINSFINLSASNFREAYQEVNNGIRYRYGGSIFITVPIKVVPFFIRGGYDQTDFTNLVSRSYDLTFTTRVDRISLNLGYRNTARETSTFTSVSNTYNASASYSTPRTENIWRLFRGIYMRGQITFLDDLNNWDRFNIAFSRNVFAGGQLQFNYTYFNATRTGNFFLSFNFDIPYFRSNTSWRGTRQNTVLNQNIRGSVAYFPKDNIVLFDNRQQVGRSAVIFNSYIDSDGDGVYSEGDEIVPFNAMRIQGAGTRVFQKKGRTLFTQLRQYESYNVEVNQALIRDPSLVPLRDKFSIVTDPNQFKYIEVEYSRSGILQGTVIQDFGDVKQPVSGLNMRILRIDTESLVTARTFFDGSFYQMELIPAVYRVYPDSAQLGILRARAVPEYIEFEIEPSEYGDFKDVEFVLVPLTPRVRPEPEPEPIAVVQFYRVQAAMMSTLPRAIIAKAEIERMTGVPFELQYSNTFQLFRLFSREIEEHEEASRMVAVLQRSEFSDAYIITDSDLESEDIFYTVQVGAFRTRRSAEIHAEEARSSFGLNVDIFEDTITGWFKVQTERQADWRVAAILRTQIREETSYKDAFVSTRLPIDIQGFSYIIQIGVYNNREMAQSAAVEASNRTGMQFEIISSRRMNYYSVQLRGIRNWDEAVQVRDRLRREYNIMDVLILTIQSQ